MAEISRTASFGKLNPLAYKAIEGATVFCKMRGNPLRRAAALADADPEQPDSDLHRIVRHYELDTAALVARPDAVARPAAARRVFDQRPLAASSTTAVERGWVYGSLMFGEHAGAHRPPGGGHVEDAHRCAVRCWPSRKQFDRIDVDDLCSRLRHAAGGLARSRAPRPANGGAAPGEASDAIAPGGDGQAGGAQALHHRPDRAGAQRQDGPDRRPRRRDPAGGRHPDAPAPEQPDPGRRGRRRQDRGGRGLRAAHRARRRAAGAEGRASCARSTSACCRPAPA